MTLNRKAIDKLMELRGEGLSIAELCRRTRLSTNTVLKYIHDDLPYANDDSMPVSDNPMPVSEVDDDNEVIGLQKTLKTKKLRREISVVPAEQPEVMLAPQLKRKLDALGMTPRDIFRISPKTWYHLLNKIERGMLKVYMDKYIISAEIKEKQSWNELIEVSKQSLDQLYHDAIDEKISESEYNNLSEEILMQVEVALSIE